MESIIIGSGADRVEVVLIETDRGKVRLGVKAPKNVAIYRNEIEPKENRCPPQQPLPAPQPIGCPASR